MINADHATIIILGSIPLSTEALLFGDDERNVKIERELEFYEAEFAL